MVVFLICLVCVFGVHYLLSDFSYDFLYRKTISRIFLIAGALSGVLGVLVFRLNSTTVDPTKPDKASRLVTTGIYQYTRNPMYLGLALVLLGGIVRIGNPIGFVFLVLFVSYMTRFQIRPEEKALEEIFGEVFVDYKRSVRRWI